MLGLVRLNPEEAVKLLDGREVNLSPEIIQLLVSRKNGEVFATPNFSVAANQGKALAFHGEAPRFHLGSVRCKPTGVQRNVQGQSNLLRLNAHHRDGHHGGLARLRVDDERATAALSVKGKGERGFAPDRTEHLGVNRPFHQTERVAELNLLQHGVLVAAEEQAQPVVDEVAVGLAEVVVKFQQKLRDVGEPVAGLWNV